MARVALSMQLVEAQTTIAELRAQITRMARYEDALRHEVSQAKADVEVYRNLWRAAIGAEDHAHV